MPPGIGSMAKAAAPAWEGAGTVGAARVLMVNSFVSLLELFSFVHRTRRFDERYLAPVACVYKIELCNIEPVGSIP